MGKDARTLGGPRVQTGGLEMVKAYTRRPAVMTNKQFLARFAVKLHLKYPNQWILICDGDLVASGPDRESVAGVAWTLQNKDILFLHIVGG